VATWVVAAGDGQVLDQSSAEDVVAIGSIIALVEVSLVVCLERLHSSEHRAAGPPTKFELPLG